MNSNTRSNRLSDQLVVRLVPSILRWLEKEGLLQSDESTDELVVEATEISQDGVAQLAGDQSLQEPQ